MNNADFAQDEENFSIWLEEFKDVPFKQSASGPLIGECLESIRFNPDVIEKYSNQAEFTRSMGEYVGIAASEARAEAGRSKLAANRETLSAIEDLYGVDAAILIAIWGIETDYGRRMGGFRVLDSLATLAGCGARREFFEAELKAAVRIVLSGAVGIPEFKGSWAGAMGHTQFMPTSYLEFAVSFKGGRKPDIWGACPLDALTSTANYLARHGWKKGVRWSEEVVLEQGFDYSLATEANWMDAEEWQAAGVRFLDERPSSEFGTALLLLPAGKDGPALLASENYNALRSYNRAAAYVISVGDLSDKIAGRSGIRTEWPPAAHHLSKQEVEKLQRALAARGYETGGLDGLAGPATRSSIREVQRISGLVLDGYPGREIYNLLCG